MSNLVQGPVPEYGAVYTQIDANTLHGRYAGGSTLEWFGPFEAELLRPIHLKDSFGRFNADGRVHLYPGRVFVTRVTSSSRGVEYQVLSTGGLRNEVPAERAAEFLKCRRDADGRLVPANEDPVYKNAVVRYRRMMSY